MGTVAREVAEAEFDRFCQAMDLDVSQEKMDLESLSGFKQQKEKVVTAIENGSLIINDAGEPVFMPQRTKDWKDPIHFTEPTGATYMEMDRKKKDQDVSKLFAIMSSMTGVYSGQLAKLKGTDIKLCQALTALFLA